MKLIILDKDFQTMGSIPLFRTLIWDRRYEKLGCFELYTSKDYFPLLNTGKYLYRSDAVELGVIDEVNFSQDETGARESYAKGNFSEKLLTARVIECTVNLSGNAETELRKLVQRTAIDPEEKDRKIKHLRLGEITGIKDSIDIQTTGDNLSEKLYEVGNTLEISHRVRYDYLTDDLAFELWKGKDRRDTQEENSWAIFSNSFYNIRNVVYNRDESSYKNFAYVAGAGEGADRKIVTVDLRLPGEERLEIWVDARDLQDTDNEGNPIPDSVYTAQLKQRGREKLAEYRKVETVTSSVDLNANLVYKKDFDLGDYCTYINTEICISTDKRITEAMETYEGGAMDLSVTFGTDEITTVQQLIKREA